MRVCSGGAPLTEPIRIRVHYDFSSTICYVAHRVMERLAPSVEELGLELAWTPIDLAGLLPYRRGEPMRGARRDNALRVAEELGVEVRMPGVWLDSRTAHAEAIHLEPGPATASWRERVFSAVFEEGRSMEGRAAVRGLAHELALDCDDAALERGERALLARTEAAGREQVSGVPTFMLGSWPFGGIQSEDTMRRVLGRFAERARAGSIA